MSSSDSPPSMPPPDNESAFQHVLRSAKNALTKCFGTAKTGNDKAKIKYNLYMIENRKKAFGVAFLNLKLASTVEGAIPNDEAVQTLVDNALADIAKLQKEIEGFQESILKKEASVKRKIVTKPAADSTGPPAAAATTTTTAAAAAAGTVAAAPAETAITAPAVATTEMTTPSTVPAAVKEDAVVVDAPAPEPTKVEAPAPEPPKVEATAAETTIHTQ